MMYPKDRIESSERHMRHVTHQADIVVIWVCPVTTTPPVHVVMQILTRIEGKVLHNWVLGAVARCTLR